MTNRYNQPVTVRLATRDDLIARGYEEAEITKILDRQDGEPGTVLATYLPKPMKKTPFGKWTLKD